MDYHIARNGEQLGVFSESQIRASLADETCQLTDVAWREGMVGWKPLSELFAPTMSESSTPPVPPQSAVYFLNSSSPKVSGLSISSLACGILSFITCGVTGLPGIICGHMALSRIKKSMGAVGGNGVAIAGLVTSYIGFSIIGISVLAGLAFPAFAMINEKGAQAKSMSNARQIVIACKLYAGDHNGKYPADLDELVTTRAFTDDKVLHDPLLHDETQIGYEYFGAEMKDTDPPNKILLMSKSTDSRGKKVVAHNDGNVLIEVPPAH